MNSTPFETNLLKKFHEKGLSDTSVMLYMKNLRRLNAGQPLQDFKFLDRPKVIEDFLNQYAETTKRNFIIAIVSALNLAGTTAKHKKLYGDYYKLMMDKNKEIKENGGKTKEGMPSWDAVLEKYNALKTKVLATTDFSKDTAFNDLLKLLVTSLYVLQPPRRNGDYLEMKVVPTYSEELPQNMNYLDTKKGEFIFNKYKTSKKYGEFRKAIEPELRAIVSLYLKHHPNLWEGRKQKKEPVPFLVYRDGEPLHQLNSITRLINSVLGKGVGSSALRHIYITEKYGKVEEEKAKDAEAMAHSVGMQKDYILK